MPPLRSPRTGSKTSSSPTSRRPTTPRPVLPLRREGRRRPTLRYGVIRRCTLVSIGKPKGWAAEGSEDYAKRLRRYFPVNIIEVAEEDMNRRSPEEVLSAEGRRILNRLPKETYVVSLDRENGKQHPSETL